MFQLVSRRTFLATLVPAALAVIAIAATVQSQEQPLSEPLEQPILVSDRLTPVDYTEAVPPDPEPYVAPSEAYHPLDSFTPALVAEEILRLRETLGEAPLGERPGFQPLPLANDARTKHQANDEPAVPAPWQRDEDRRHLRDRLRGLATRPALTPPAPLSSTSKPISNPFLSAPVCFPSSTAPVCNPPFTAVHPAFAAAVPCTTPAFGSPVPPTTYYAPTTAFAVPTPPLPEQQNIQSLRHCAQQLDQIANQLESQDLFDRADEARKLADHLRQDARELRKKDRAEAAERPVRPAASYESPAPYPPGASLEPAGPPRTPASEVRY